MQTIYRSLFSLAALAGLTAASVAAQTAPPSPSASTTPAPSPSPSATATTAPAPNANGASHSSTRSHHYRGQLRHLLTAKLSAGQIHYALTHQRQEADRLRRMHTIDFRKLRIVRISGLHTSQAEFLQFDLAQTTLPSSNGSNSPIQYLQNVLANINISNALNNTLNNATVNVVVPLTDVLNNDNIAIGQVVGVYINSAGLVYTLAG